MLFSFTRLIDSADTSGQDIDLNVCQYVLYAWGGSVSSFTSPATIGRHTSRGAFANQICLQQCDRGKCILITCTIQRTTYGLHIYILLKVID